MVCCQWSPDYKRNFRNEIWTASTAQDVLILVSPVGTLCVTVVNAETSRLLEVKSLPQLLTLQSVPRSLPHPHLASTMLTAGTPAHRGQGYLPQRVAEAFSRVNFSPSSPLLHAWQNYCDLGSFCM